MLLFTGLVLLHTFQPTSAATGVHLQPRLAATIPDYVNTYGTIDSSPFGNRLYAGDSRLTRIYSASSPPRPERNLPPLGHPSAAQPHIPRPELYRNHERTLAPLALEPRPTECRRQLYGRQLRRLPHLPDVERQHHREPAMAIRRPPGPDHARDHRRQVLRHRRHGPQ